VSPPSWLMSTAADLVDRRIPVTHTAHICRQVEPVQLTNFRVAKGVEPWRKLALRRSLDRIQKLPSERFIVAKRTAAIRG
jgi:hypothetical protein